MYSFLFPPHAAVALEPVGYDTELFVEQEPDKTADQMAGCWHVFVISRMNVRT
jgi:hypothetical protein